MLSVFSLWSPLPQPMAQMSQVWEISGALDDATGFFRAVIFINASIG
jgi:hypothetical protein